MHSFQRKDHLYLSDLDTSSRQRHPWKQWLLGFTVLSALVLLFSNPLQDKTLSHILKSLSERRNPAYLVKAKHGAVASENKRCSDIGVDVLKDGGNAIDAAISVTFCVGVVNMFSCVSGVGGGGFMIVRIPPDSHGHPSEVHTIDFRETAPALSNSSMYVKSPDLAKYGGLSVGVPGEVRGLEEAYRRWGSRKLSWKRLVEPSVSLAEGWEVDKELGKRIPWFPDLMLNNPDWSAIFAPQGRFLREGELIRRTNLSRTLGRIAQEGADAFYKGPIAHSLVHKVRSTGGILSHLDLENYSVKVDLALQGTYRGRKVYATHAPTSGPVFLHMMNLLERYRMKERTALNAHRIVEIMKFGFAARQVGTKICDPDFNNDTARIDQISTKIFADAIFRNITDDRTHPSEYYNPDYGVKIDHGTSHTSVVDKHGMAVALTSTVNLVFGSQVLDPVTGIILNDEMDDFSIPGIPNAFDLLPSPYNFPEPGKRPLSSTIPTIIEHADGSLFVAIGGSGGSQIFGAVFQTLLNLDLGLDVSQAIEFGRLHDQLYPPILEADSVYPPEILDGLRDRGHNVTVRDINRVAAAVQVVVQQNGKITAASDSRKNGIASGY
ncbi:gamma-glutamyltranspeptidase [Tricholoma matsutake]|nr:gamma-glutamyltranspeptidase [Tricholoma matsutake 945]